MPGILYVVATPIGNLNELTPRAFEVLGQVDLIAAEDTRNTGMMLAKLGKADDKFSSCRKFTSYHKFNEFQKKDAIIEKLQGGQSVALVSDAGTPCISDPGFLLVRAAADAEIPVVAVGGPCAVTTALSVSGFPGEPFLFVGFLPRKRTAIVDIFVKAAVPCILFYESPKRIIAVVNLLAEYFPGIQLCLCNDLTKKYERIYRGVPGEVLNELANNPHCEKGEYTCVVYMPGGSADEGSSKNNQPDKDTSPSLESQLTDIMAKTGCTLKEAVKVLSEKQVSEKRVTKKEIYAASLRLKGMFV